MKANFGCSASQVATKTVNVGINPIIPAPINTNLPPVCEVSDDAYTISIGNGDALTTYDWSASGGVLFSNGASKH